MRQEISDTLIVSAIYRKAVGLQRMQLLMSAERRFFPIDTGKLFSANWRVNRFQRQKTSA